MEVARSREVLVVVSKAVEVVTAATGTAMEAGAAMIAARRGTVGTARIDVTVAAVGTAMEIGGSAGRGMVETAAVRTACIAGIRLRRMVFEAAAIGSATEARIGARLAVWRAAAMIEMTATGRAAMLRLRGGPAMRSATAMLAATTAMAVVVMARLAESRKGKKCNDCSRNKQFSHIACPENGWKVTGPPGLSSLCCGAILWSTHERFFHPCRD